MVFVVRGARRRCVSAVLRVVVRTVRRPRLCPRLSVAVVLIAAALVALVFAVVKLSFLPPPPRYAVFGLDRHQSVTRLLESDVSVTRLDDDGVENRTASTGETVGIFLVIDPTLLQHQTASPGNVPNLGCRPSYRYHVFIITSSVLEPAQQSEDRKQYLHDNDVNNATVSQLRHGCMREAGATFCLFWPLYRLNSQV